MTPLRNKVVSLRACDTDFTITCSESTEGIIQMLFGGLLSPGRSVCDARTYHVIDLPNGEFTIALHGSSVRASDADDLLLHLDKLVTVAVQYARPDLFFIHGGAVAGPSGAICLIAPSGTGKSTLTLRLVERGARYLSDELSPVDARRRVVHAYPHALCLKTLPPGADAPPAHALALRTRMHVPVATPLVVQAPQPLAALVILHRRGTPAAVRPVAPSVAAAHLIANALNSLAHPDCGLDAAARIASSTRAFELDITSLDEAAHLIDEMLNTMAN